VSREETNEMGLVVGKSFGKFVGKFVVGNSSAEFWIRHTDMMKALTKHRNRLTALRTLRCARGASARSLRSSSCDSCCLLGWLILTFDSSMPYRKERY
jgi:hypothetical protein